MTTSLARQLASLRTPGSVSSSLPVSVYSGPFLFPEAETEHSSLASLKECVAESLSLLCVQDPSLARYSVLLEMEEDEEEAEQMVTDCLTSICPHLLLRPAQWMLQWLVTRHKVHMTSPSWLVFTVLPYYSYQIYQTVLQCVDSTIKQTKPGTEWLVQFKQNCFPTTQLGLHRHTSSNPAFLRFLCDSMVELNKHLAKYQDTKVHKQTTLVVTAMLGGLENIVEVGDERLLMLLQVILSGFKSSNQDMNGVSSILLSYLLPKVTFKPKAATKLCKSVSKFSKSNPTHDTLYLVMLLARTQQVNMDTIMEMVLNHQPVINMIENEAKHGEGEEIGDYVDSLIYSMAMVLVHLQPPKGEVKLSSTQEEVQLVDLVHSLVSIETHMQEVTAEFLVEGVVELIKSVEVNIQTSSFSKKLEKVLASVQSAWPEVYRVAMVKGGQGRKGDILFLPGVERPSDKQLEASRIMSSNQLVQTLSTRVLVDVKSAKGLKKILKSNNEDLKKVLECETTFLLSQLEPAKLEVFLLNLIIITENFSHLQDLSVSHACSSSMLPLLTLKPVLELHLLPVLFTSPASTSSIILSSTMCSSSSLLSLLSSISPSANNFKATVAEKLALLLTPTHLTTILSTPSLLHSTTLVTIFLSLSPKLLAGSKSEWQVGFANLLHECLKMTNIEKGEDSDEVCSLVMEAKDKGSLPWDMVMKTVNKVLSSREDKDVASLLLLSLPPLMERGMAEEAKQIRKSLLDHLESDSLHFLLQTASVSSDLKVVCLCLMEAAELCTETKTVSKMLKDKTDTSLLHLLSLVFHPKSRVQKAAYTVLEKLEASSETGLIMPMLKFFTNNKAEIVNNTENFPTILSREKVDTKACRELLARCTMGQVELFVKLAPVFKCLTNTKDVETIFKFGSECLMKEDVTAGEVVREMITEFTEVLIANLGSETVWTFFLSCLSSKMMVTCSGLTKHVSHLLLSSLASSPLLVEKVKDKQLAKLLSALVKFCLSDTTIEARNLVLASPLSPSLLLDQFKNIWGQEAFSGGRVVGRGKFSLLYGSKDTSEEDVERWVQTCWLLEVTEKLLGQQKGKEEDWLLLARPMFVLLRKVADMEVEEGTYKLSLLLSVLLQLLSLVPDSKLQQLETGQLDPELLVHCIRTSPSPDTRQTALQVLARCAVSNPDFILQNSITIFTFMGSHLLKVDSKHSFQVACQALEVIVPAIKTACQAPGKAHQLQATCLGVLTTFVDASLDIPAHRLTEFLVRLINCLGDSEHLWIAALLLVRKDKAGGERRVVELFSQLEVERGLEALLRLLVNTRSDGPHLRKMFGVGLERREEEAVEKPDEWDVLRLRALQVVTQVLSATSFKRRVGQVVEEDEVGQMLNLLIEAAILTIQEYGTISVPMPAKLKKNLVNQSERVLEYSLSLLPPSLFLQLTSSLLSSTTPSVRQRALEVVSSKLSPPSPLPIPSLPPLVSPLTTLALTEDQPHTQQLALLAVRQLAKLLPDPQQLLQAAEAFTCSFLSQLSNSKVLGAAVLSCGDILTSPAWVPWPWGEYQGCWAGSAPGWRGSRSVASGQTSRSQWSITASFTSPVLLSPETVGGICWVPSPYLTQAMSCKMRGSSPSTIGRLTCLATTIPPHTTLSLSTQLMESVWSEASSVPAFVNFIADKQLQKAGEEPDVLRLQADCGLVHQGPGLQVQAHHRQ